MVGGRVLSVTCLSLLGNEMRRDETARHVSSHQSHTAADEAGNSDD